MNPLPPSNERLFRVSRWAVALFCALPAVTVLRAAALSSAPAPTPLAPARVAALSLAAGAEVERALVMARGEDAADVPPVRLLGVTLVERRLTLNFSRELAALDPGSAAGERFLRSLHRAAAEVLRVDYPDFEIFTLIEGVPLHEVLARVEGTASGAARRAPAAAAPVLPSTPAEGGFPPPLPPAVPAPLALAARRIAVSPGHGYYLNPANSWVLQRGYWQGIVEDFVNHDLITRVGDELAAAGAKIFSTRQLDRTAGPGESGRPQWQEAARYHLKATGVDASVWNEPGYVHYDQDIRCRPRYANAIDADILVSLHNNGAGTPGTGTGTETLYDTSNGFGAESKRLADAVHSRVIAALRRDYNASWADRRVQGFNGSYGENRLATRPSILIELAFMDRPTPDNAALQDVAFQQLVARAIREGVEDYFAGPPATVPPAPTGLSATGGPASVGLAWTDPATNESGFRLERRSGAAAAWEPCATLGPNATTYTDYTVAAGATYHYRVFALNAVGTSVQPSNEASAAPLEPQPVARLANVSLRTTLAAGQAVAVGFVVTGQPRSVLLRVAGPSLADFGVPGVMADPRLEVYRSEAKLAENNDWSPTLAATMAAYGAFPFGRVSRDAAWRQPIEGLTTVLASGTAAGTVLIEGYDTSADGAGRIVNLSARNRVGTGADVLIAGFHLAGTGTKRLLVRAVGPTLADFGVAGVLADPQLELYAAGAAKLAENDNWDPALAPVFASVSAFPLPLRSRDAALVLTLAAGHSYTAQVSGVGGTTGEALVELYELP